MTQTCVCFPGMCRGGQVVNGKTPSGSTCREWLKGQQADEIPVPCNLRPSHDDRSDLEVGVMRAPLLTYEQIRLIAGQQSNPPWGIGSRWVDALNACRAVESAVRAPLLAEIERLTAERLAHKEQIERLQAALELIKEIEAPAHREACEDEMEQARSIAIDALAKVKQC